MDLQISVFLLFILFTAGHSLNCYECLGLTGSCSGQTVKTCPSGSSKCVGLTAVTHSGQISVKVKGKDCVPACQSGSMNFGIVRMTTSCCNTDQCNAEDAPDPPNIPNGKTCYSCDAQQSCSNRVSCSGTEDHCIKATYTIEGYEHYSFPVKGCASESICDATASVPNVQDISCCEGYMCNGAQSVTQSFLFLCCSLLSYFLLH